MTEICMDNSNLETIKPDEPRLDFGNSYLLELKRKGHRLTIGNYISSTWGKLSHIGLNSLFQLRDTLISIKHHHAYLAYKI